MKLLASAPLLVQGAVFHQDDGWARRRQWDFGHNFLYAWNDADRLLFRGRLAVLALGAALAAAVYWWTRIHWGGAAAALALFFVDWRQPAKTTTERSVSHAIAVSVRYAPHALGPGAGPRVDCFQSTASEPCTMVALLRTWNSACECLMWELHQWEDGATLAEVSPGEPVDVRLDVADSPPVQQLLVLAVSRERGDLPDRPDKAEELLECLNHSAPPLGATEDTASYASAVSACLPQGVTVVPASFVPR